MKDRQKILDEMSDIRRRLFDLEVTAQESGNSYDCSPESRHLYERLKELSILNIKLNT